MSFTTQVFPVVMTGPFADIPTSGLLFPLAIGMEEGTVYNTTDLPHQTFHTERIAGVMTWVESVGVAGPMLPTFWIVNLSTAMRTLEPTVRRFTDQDGKISAKAIQQQVNNDFPQGWPLVATPKVKFWTGGTSAAQLAVLYADPIAYPMFVLDADPDGPLGPIHGIHGTVGDPLFVDADGGPIWEMPQIPLVPPVGRVMSITSTITRIAVHNVLVEPFAVTGAVVPPPTPSNPLGISSQTPEGCGILGGKRFPSTCAVLSHEILEALVDPVGVLAQDIGQYAGFPIYDAVTDSFLPLAGVPSNCADAKGVVWPDTGPDGITSAGGPFMLETAVMECVDSVDRMLPLGTGYYQQTVLGFGPPILADVANFLFANWFNPSWAIADAYADVGAPLPTGLLPTPAGQRYDFLGILTRALHVIVNTDPLLYPTSGPVQNRVLPSSMAGRPIEPNITAPPPCATFPPGTGEPTTIQSCPGAPPVSTPPGAIGVVWFGSDGMSLPQPVINVYSTKNFPSSGTILVDTDAGTQTVTYTGITDTQFTGCLGGVGMMSVFNSVSEQTPNDSGRIPIFAPLLNTQSGVSIGFDITFLLATPNTDGPPMMMMAARGLAAPAPTHMAIGHNKRGLAVARAKAHQEKKIRAARAK